MKLGIQGKLFLGSVVLTLLAVATGGAYLETKLRRLVERRIEEEVARYALGARVMFQRANPESVEDVDTFADGLGKASDTRITFIAPSGVVRGDSRVPTAEIAALDNHKNRPEIRQARHEGIGMARRYSATLNQEMLYVATRLDDGGVVRAAMSLTSVGQAVIQLRIALLGAGLIALLVSLLASALVARWASRALRAIVDRTRSIAKGGSTRMVVSSSDELGTLAGSINQLADELQSAVARLASERDRLQAILQSMKDAVVVINELNQIELQNPAALELLGRGAAGDTVTEAVGAPALPQLATAGGREPGGTEFAWRGRTLRAHASELKASGSRVLVLHDVTEARRLDEMRRNFVANVSHELRTPVSVIRANSETLLDGALKTNDNQARGFVEATLRNAERLSNLISDLLDLASIEGGGYPLEVTSVALDAASRRVTDGLRQNASQRNIDLRVDVPQDHRVQADTGAVEQVLINLVSNAIKYTYEGTHITIRSRVLGAHVRTEVIDQGPGISPEHRLRVFERFYRVDVGRSRALGGTGLGLSIAKHLVNAMGGEIGVEPIQPNGSCFWFTLPVARTAETAA